MRTLLKLTWVEMKLFIREPITMAFTFAIPIIFLFVLGGVFGDAPFPYEGSPPDIPAMEYYVPAYVGLVLAAIGAIAMPVQLTSYRERGVLRRLRASSISIWSLFGAHALVSLVTATIGAVILVSLAIAFYGVHVPKAPLLALAAFFLGTLSFAGFGFLLGAIIPTTRAAQGLGVILFFVMLVLAGAGPPRQLMSSLMKKLGDFTPLRHVILSLQEPWIGGGWNTEASLIVLGVLVVSVVLAARLFRWE